MRHETLRRRHAVRALALSSILAVAALAGAGPARADDGLHEHVRGVLRDLGRIPDRIHDHHVRHLEVFSGGRQYYRPHRHHHQSYLFPVWIDGAVAYQPYSYCNGHLFQPVAHRPHLWSDWGHGRGGAWCGRHRGYFPRQHGCFHQARHERRYDDRHGCRGDWDDCDRHKKGHKHKHGRGHGHHDHDD